MKCKKAERFISKSIDRPLPKEINERLNTHLKNCLLCQEKQIEYNNIIRTLKRTDFPESRPYFWERLQPKLKEARDYEPWSLWKRWSLRAVPLSLICIVLFAGAILFLLPKQSEELSQSGAFLLRDLNPLQETQTILEEEGVENKNMMLLFTAMEEKNGTRRYLP